MTRAKFCRPQPPSCGGVYTVTWQNATHAVLARGTTGVTARIEEIEPATEDEYGADRSTR